VSERRIGGSVQLSDVSQNNRWRSQRLWTLAGVMVGLGIGALVFIHLRQLPQVPNGPLLVGVFGTAALALVLASGVQTPGRFLIQASLFLGGTLIPLPIGWLPKALAAATIVALWKWGLFTRTWARVVLVVAPACIGLASSLLAFKAQERALQAPNACEPARQRAR
jgi:hypothetical protein